MKVILVLLFFLFYVACNGIKIKNATANKSVVLTTPASVTSPSVSPTKKVKVLVGKKTTKTKSPPPITKKKKGLVLVNPTLINRWASEISDTLQRHESSVVRPEVLLKGFSTVKSVVRSGASIVNKMTNTVTELLEKRAKAAEAIMKKAENLAKRKITPPPDYQFDHSVALDEIKKRRPPSNSWEYYKNCTRLENVKVTKSKHFDGKMTLDTSSVYVGIEVFDCDQRVLPHVYWSEELNQVFRDNYEQDATLDFQYFCSAKGFMRHFPAAVWESLFKLKLDNEVDDEDDDAEKVLPQQLYDCRLRQWYVAAGGAPRDILILVDASGSMYNSSNKVVAEFFTSTLLSALSDDDQVNVLRFNVVVESPIKCFNEKLVSANMVNSAAMLAAMKQTNINNETDMLEVLSYSVRLLKEQKDIQGRPQSCQQAIVLVTDQLYDNFTEKMKMLDPTESIRLFVLWLHDPFGIRDDTRSYGQAVTCARDGYFAELITHSDVTEQVMNILQVLERPLVSQRKERLRVFSDVYANLEDPRRSSSYWLKKENEEQGFRYRKLRQNKDKLLSEEQMYKDYMRQEDLQKHGHYYEGQDINYRLKITVSVPIFDDTRKENITIKLFQAKPLNSTRTYPVNRLLGVAGIDIPIDHLKLVLPYYQLGPGGSLFLVDHRGNIVLHDNVKTTFDGDILRPGYRTIDFLDLEQPAADHLPRHYPKEWLDFRQELIIDKPNGNKTIKSKYIFEGGVRAHMEFREYHWKRILNHYTAVVALPTYHRQFATFDSSFTQELAESAYASLYKTDFAVQPNWLYCQHVEQYFDARKHEVLHFIRRRRDNSDFSMQNLKHFFSPLQPTLLTKTYQCLEELMARLCADAVATDTWANEPQDKDVGRDCTPCTMGSTTAFIVTESGLTRWQQYHATSAHKEPLEGEEWADGPKEPWYTRAAAASPKLVIHAPVLPKENMRNSFKETPSLPPKYEWMTAARVLTMKGKGLIGVTGYHFYPQHMDDLFETVTNSHCTEVDENLCEPRCDGVDWSCVLVDEGGWILTRTRRDDEIRQESSVREHLATVYPGTMAKLLNESVFKLNWIHDYQGVCFPSQEEETPDDVLGGASSLPSLFKSMWYTVKLLIYTVHDLAILLTVSYHSPKVSGDTELEKQKRHIRTLKDFEREKYERLYDDRVLINRTRFAACDRSRPIYELQNTQRAKEMLKRPADVAGPKHCTWPLVAVEVPDTNLLLIAIYNGCPYHGQPVPDPMVNEPVDITDKDIDKMDTASRLACWRHRVPLLGRPPHTRCFPHNYSSEVGYRQCGPWLSDPEENCAYAMLCHPFLIHFLIFCWFINVT